MFLYLARHFHKLSEPNSSLKPRHLVIFIIHQQRKQGDHDDHFDQADTRKEANPPM